MVYVSNPSDASDAPSKHHRAALKWINEMAYGFTQASEYRRKTDYILKK
jgi:hypothetical protein